MLRSGLIVLLIVFSAALLAGQAGGQRGAPPQRSAVGGGGAAANSTATGFGTTNTLTTIPEAGAGSAADDPTPEQLAASPEAQLAAIQRENSKAEAHKRDRATERDIALTEAQHYAEWLLARSDIHELPTIISWLEGCKPKDVISALRREAA